MNNFHKVILPDFISVNLKGGPSFANSIVKSISGREFRISERHNSYQKYMLDKCILSKSEFEILSSFFRNRRGSLFSFLIKDFSDFQIKDQIIDNYNDDSESYILEKIYLDSSYSNKRRIYYIDKDSFQSNIELGEIDYDRGLLYTKDRDLELKISCNFYVRVRFKSDYLDYSYRDDDSILVENLYLVEV